MIAWLLISLVGIGVVGLAILEFAPGTRLANFVDRQIGRSEKVNLSDFNDIEELTATDVALIEKKLPNLKSVIVLCNKVDAPDIEFKKAVLDNFEEGVSYSFFVSEGNSSKPQLEMYRDTFLHLHAAACAPANSEHSATSKTYCRRFEDAFHIGVLPLDWQNVPYIFYVFDDLSGPTSIIAFKGTEVGVGISSFYVKVQETEARAILELCGAASVGLDKAFNGDDMEIVEALPAFDEDNVIPMRSAGRK